MQKPTLVVMAAGMGSRYGGLKQIDPIGRHGEIIMDYSLYDAMQAGFEKVVFIINHRIEEDFCEVVGRRAEKHFEVHYVFQQPETLLPPGFSVPAGRTKPWGTAHAILCCQDVVHEPFAAINADDYYGKHAFFVLYNYLKTAKDSDKADFSMVGYLAKNTLTEHGSVARGVCKVSEKGELIDIVERLKVFKTPSGPAYTEDDGKTFVHFSGDNLVSMNFFGFTPSLFPALEARFPEFLQEALETNPLKGEFLIPAEVGRMLRSEKACVRVLSSPDRWYGVTYREDKPEVQRALDDLTKAGIYPDEKLIP
ncbi:MAG: sugar phosphate nucleotidyltransferase [Eubacteriales bacterium]|nr:sugar phosphate nucleotidyltransferase [Eubacteriales bacterium]